MRAFLQHIAGLKMPAHQNKFFCQEQTALISAEFCMARNLSNNFRGAACRAAAHLGNLISDNSLFQAAAQQNFPEVQGLEPQNFPLLFLFYFAQSLKALKQGFFSLSRLFLQQLFSQRFFLKQKIFILKRKK